MVKVGSGYTVIVLQSMSHIIFSIMGAIPFYFAWNMIASTYLTFLPKVYHHLPYWHIVSIFIICTYLGEQISKLTPKVISISQSNK